MNCWLVPRHRRPNGAICWSWIMGFITMGFVITGSGNLRDPKRSTALLRLPLAFAQGKSSFASFYNRVPFTYAVASPFPIRYPQCSIAFAIFALPRVSYMPVCTDVHTVWFISTISNPHHPVVVFKEEMLPAPSRDRISILGKASRDISFVRHPMATMFRSARKPKIK